MSDEMGSELAALVDFIDDIAGDLINHEDPDLHRAFCFEFYFRALIVLESDSYTEQFRIAVSIAAIFYGSLLHSTFEYVSSLRDVLPDSSNPPMERRKLDSIIGFMADTMSCYCHGNAAEFDGAIALILEETKLAPKHGYEILRSMGYSPK